MPRASIYVNFVTTKVKATAQQSALHGLFIAVLEMNLKDYA
jgi:hypothetical protein